MHCCSRSTRPARLRIPRGRSWLRAVRCLKQTHSSSAQRRRPHPPPRNTTQRPRPPLSTRQAEGKRKKAHQRAAQRNAAGGSESACYEQAHHIRPRQRRTAQQQLAYCKRRHAKRAGRQAGSASHSAVRVQCECSAQGWLWEAGGKERRQGASPNVLLREGRSTRHAITHALGRSTQLAAHCRCERSCSRLCRATQPQYDGRTRGCVNACASHSAAEPLYQAPPPLPPPA